MHHHHHHQHHHHHHPIGGRGQVWPRTDNVRSVLRRPVTARSRAAGPGGRRQQKHHRRSHHRRRWRQGRSAN
jgi:hypothetical protein